MKKNPSSELIFWRECKDSVVNGVFFFGVVFAFCGGVWRDRWYFPLALVFPATPVLDPQSIALEHFLSSLVVYLL